MPTVKYGSTTLRKGVDYTLNYSNNKKVGTATISVNGKGAYTGTLKAKFKIVKRANPMKVSGKTIATKFKTLKKKSVSFANEATEFEVAVSKSGINLLLAPNAKSDLHCG